MEAEQSTSYRTGPTPPRAPTAADSVRENAERAVARVQGVRRRLEEMQERLAGTQSARGASATDMRDVTSASGFIPGTGVAVDRIHAELGAIDDLINSLSEAV